MKNIVWAFATVALLSACKNNTNQTEGSTANASETASASQQAETQDLHYYGDTISPEGAVASEKLVSMMGERDSMQVKVRGTINSSCTKKGCWMKMDLGENQEMRVSFKDYSFFVPKNLNGEQAIIDGYAHMDTLDVPYLRHLAEDAGKSKEEIESINTPEVSLNYVAHGVILKS